jgi:RNA polymerase subunit RPABC4/transcription elongation factor Spt4
MEIRPWASICPHHRKCSLADNWPELLTMTVPN